MEVDIFSSSKVLAFFIELLSGLWQDNTGKIFLITFTAYAASYMMYSGYIAWFSGGYGGLSLSQMGFTVVDFLGLIPNAFLLIFELIWEIVKYFTIRILLYVIIPTGLGFLITELSKSMLLVTGPVNFFFAPLGLLLWVIGIITGLWFIERGIKSNLTSWKVWLSIIAAIAGMMLISFAVQFGQKPLNNTPTTNISDILLGLISFAFEISAISFLFSIFVSPFIIGLKMGEYAVKNKLLSQVIKITVNKPLEINGKLKIHTPKIPGFKRENPSPELKPELFSYTWNESNPVYLLASFAKTTALYFPSSDNYIPGTLTVIANDCICSIEVESRPILKKDKGR